jgi:hypothetical protein
MSTDDLEPESEQNSSSESSGEDLNYVLQSLNSETRDVIEEKGLIEELGRLRDDVDQLLSEKGLVYRDDVLDSLDSTYTLPDSSEYRLEDYVSEFDFVIETSAPKGNAYLYSRS